jgi:hypothetical protein
LFRRILIILNLGGKFSDGRLEPAELPRDGLPQVLQQVEAISNLPRLWCALTGRVRIQTVSIAVDNLDFRMLLEPICHLCCCAIRQQIDYTAPLQVHDNGAKLCALPPSPLIDTSDTDCSSFGLGPGMSLETPHNRGVAHAHAQPSHQSRGGTPASAVTEQPDDFCQAVGLTRRRRGNTRKAFGEDLAIAPLVPAAPATHSHPDRNRYPLSGKIVERP